MRSLVCLRLLLISRVIRMADFGSRNPQAASWRQPRARPTARVPFAECLSDLVIHPSLFFSECSEQRAVLCTNGVPLRAFAPHRGFFIILLAFE